jgi:hypothetical protein
MLNLVALSSTVRVASQQGQPVGRILFIGLSSITAARTADWKYRQYINPSAPSSATALALRPGGVITVSLQNHPATAYIDSVRRIQHNGRPTFVKLVLMIDTSKLALTLDHETKCSCLYCGTEPRDNSPSCRSCGAPLPNC